MTPENQVPIDSSDTPTVAFSRHWHAGVARLALYDEVLDMVFYIPVEGREPQRESSELNKPADTD